MDAVLNNLDVFKNASLISQLVWKISHEIPKKYFWSLGDQLIRSGDSIAANIAEGYGRQSHRDQLRFLYIARGSLYELGFWLDTIKDRGFLNQEHHSQLQALLDNQGKLLSKYGNYLRNRMK